MDEEPFDLLSDDRLAARWRALLVILGLAAVAGGLFFGFFEIVTLGTSYAHESNPTPEFKAAGDASMMLALVLVIFGATCRFCTRAKHLLIVGVTAAALILCAGIAAWRDKAKRAAEPHPYVIETQPIVPPPTDIVVARQLDP